MESRFEYLAVPVDRLMVITEEQARAIIEESERNKSTPEEKAERARKVKQLFRKPGDAHEPNRFLY
jgi:hypothetical protein